MSGVVVTVGGAPRGERRWRDRVARLHAFGDGPMSRFRRFARRLTPRWALRGQICPLCLYEHLTTRDEPICPDCGAAYPQACLERPDARPLVVPLIGWTQVGKTQFLRAATTCLDSMVRLWPRFRPPEAVTPETQAFKQTVRHAARRGARAPATQLPENAAFTLLLDSMVRWGSYTLVIRDWAGEWFHDWCLRAPEARNQEAVHRTIGTLIARTRTLFLMFPLDGAWDDASERTIDDLALTYINTARGCGVDVRGQGRRFIVVLSKADEAIRRFPTRIPADIIEYLECDPVRRSMLKTGDGRPWTEAFAADYGRRMMRISDLLQGWFASESDIGRGLVRTCKHYDIFPLFTIVSAFPRGLAHDGTPLDLVPARVLDPFFWAFEIARQDRCSAGG